LSKFKFDHPELNVSRLKGTERKYVHDPFFIECRANGSLIQQGLSGHITPACYGWTDIPAAVEIHVAEKFYIHPLVWDRPASASNQKIRGILFEWIDGQPISQVPMSSDIADQARAKLKALHQSGIAHGDLAASNILVQVETEDPNSKVHLIDLSASITLPHIRFSPEELTKIQQKEIHGLEVGFALLSRISINRGLSFATISLDDIDAESQFIQHLWAPPQPTDWQSTALKPNSVP
jgi:serine/threonine protein kinase